MRHRFLRARVTRGRAYPDPMSFARAGLPLLLMAIVAATAACAVDDGGAASGSSSGGELALDFVGECEALFGCGCEYFLFADFNPTDVCAGSI